MNEFYSSLNEEERKRAAREDIPMFEFAGRIELSDEERKRARKMIQILARVSEKARKEHKRYDLSKITPDTKIEDVEFFD